MKSDLRTQDLEYRSVDVETLRAAAKDARKRGKMSDEDFESILRGSVAAAVDYYESEIAKDRADATKFYLGKPFGDEEEGRSQVVMTETADTVAAILPSLMRIFRGTENTVEFSPRRQADLAGAKIRTAYVNEVFSVDNDGYRLLHDTFKDALVREYGIVTWWWDDEDRVTATRYSGLSEAELGILLADESLDVTVDSQYETVVPLPGPDGAPTPQPVTLYNATAKRTVTEGRARVAVVPGEEFLIDREARSIDDARIVGRKRRLPASDIAALGYDIDEILDHLGPAEEADGAEELERNPRAIFTDDEAPLDPTMLKVDYYEVYVRADRDGDGIAELIRVCAVGPSLHVLHEEVVDERPFADFCGDPEPHRFGGRSIWHKTKDLQRIISVLVRNVLDSLVQSVHPRTAFVEGEVSVEDLMNTEMGGLVRMTRAGMVQELIKPFVGKEAFPLFELFRKVKENRTGISDATTGLNADALQSTNIEGIAAATQAAQQQIELIARTFAETGMKRLFRGLYRLLMQHQDKPRMLRFGSDWVEVDPRTWDADCDVIVNVGLGTGRPEEKSAVLVQIKAAQEQILQIMGPTNPLAKLHHYRHTLASLLELNGFRDVSRFFAEVPEDWAPPQQGETPPDPALLLAQIEAQKAQTEAQHKQAELQLKQQQAVWAHELAQEKLAAETELKRAEITAKYAAQVDMARLQAALDDGQHRRETIEGRAAGERDRMVDVAQAAAQRQHDAEQAEAERAHQSALQAAEPEPTEGA